MKTVLIVGGYGQFGARLSQRLAHLQNTRILVAGRTIEKAKSVCMEHKGNLEPAHFDLGADLNAQLTSLKPHIVVDAAGPFQSVFGTGYALPRHCAQMGIHYIDLSDSGAFTHGITALDELARQYDVAIVSGASSVPALSAAVVNDANKRIKTIKAIEGGISPGGKINIGLSVTKAVLSYLGRPLKIFRGGQWEEETGFSRQHKKTVKLQGEKPIKRRYGLCDAPDLLLFPEIYPDVETVRFHGSTELPIIMNTLRFLSWLQKHGLLKNLERFAGPFAWCGTQLGRFASERGCMYMDIKGIDAKGKGLRQEWNLIASDGDGPFIPILATEILVKRWLAKDPTPGARSAAGEIELSEFEQVFANLSIKSAFIDAVEYNALFQSALKDEYAHLPKPLQDAHLVTSYKTLAGTVDVQRGKNPLANLIALLFGFPKTQKDAPIKVSMDLQGEKEIWTRTIGKSAFKSVLSEGQNRNEIFERFGPVKFKIKLLHRDGRLHYGLDIARFLGIPLPKFLTPNSETYEWSRDGKFKFHVDISLPLLGRLIQYKGTLSEYERDINFKLRTGSDPII